MTRRTFLEAVPLVQAVGGGVLAQPAPGEKFTLVSLPAQTAPATPVAGVRQLVSGKHDYAGVPFQLGGGFLLLGSVHRTIAFPVGKACHYACFAHFCDPHPDDTAGPFGAENPRSEFEPVGQHIATYALVFEDGSRLEQPIRRRYEINPPGMDASHVPAAARPSFEEGYLPLDAPLGTAYDAPEVLTAQARKVPRSHGPVQWIYALPNPHPGKMVRSLELTAASETLLALSGVTLFHRPQHPLRREPLRRFRIQVGAISAGWREQWKIGVDLGIVGRVYPAPRFDSAAWLKAPYAGLGEPPDSRAPAEALIAEISASPAATITVEDTARKQVFRYDLDRASAPQVEVLDHQRTLVQGAVVDEGTGRPVAARVSFRDSAGRYIAPYGHAEDIAAGWMQNTGPDVRIGDGSYAYVDGGFQIELPAGDVFVEIWKGFEYAPTRRKISIAAGQRELRLSVRRALDSNRAGWVTADTHVHTGTPQLLVLEGAAEGLNLVNLLAAQWGRHFTNFVDRPGRFEGSTPETTVWVGSENRNHFLGHIGLLGVRGTRITPFSDCGPPVAYFGSPLTTTLADWADACRAQGGVTVGVHFPIPNGETAVDVVLGKLDAAEIRYDRGFAALGVTEYYRYLNCGYRLAAVGGTDKMMSTRAVGAVRTYARLEKGEPFGFDAWARAVRAGRTFVSCGPLLYLRVDGLEPGATVSLKGEREVEIEALAESVFPLGEIEIVRNGKVVASGAAPLRTRLKMERAGWIAARCTSRDRLSYGMRNIGAHTSPVYFTEAGKPGFDPRAGRYLLKLMEGAILWVDTLATPAGRAQMERIRNLFEEARGSLNARLQEHSHV